jgi:hypothetical protein
VRVLCSVKRSLPASASHAVSVVNGSVTASVIVTLSCMTIATRRLTHSPTRPD